MAYYNQNEYWRYVLNSDEYYLISNLGRVKSYYSYGRNRKNKKEIPTFLKIQKTTFGYPCVNLFIDNKNIVKNIHSLILESFVGPRPKLYQAAHLDGDPSNSVLHNLKWVTCTENMRHKKIHGTHRCGEQLPHAKMTNLARKSILNKIETGKRVKDIADYYGLDQSTVSKMKSRHFDFKELQ